MWEIWIGSTAAIAALITSIINIFMLVEQKKTFKKSLEPFVVPEVKNYQCKYKLNDPSFYNVDFGRSEEKKAKVTPSGYKNTRLALLNLGEGVAKELKLKIELINCEETITAINQSLEKKNEKLTLTIIEDPYLPNTNSLRVTNETIYGHSEAIYPLNNFKERDYIYLFPEKEQPEVSFPLPSPFIVLYNLALYTEALFVEQNKRIYPKLKLSVHCKDNLNKVHHFDYIYHFSFVNQKMEKIGDAPFNIVNWEFILEEYN